MVWPLQETCMPPPGRGLVCCQSGGKQTWGFGMLTHVNENWHLVCRMSPGGTAVLIQTGIGRPEGLQLKKFTTTLEQDF